MPWKLQRLIHSIILLSPAFLLVCLHYRCLLFYHTVIRIITFVDFAPGVFKTVFFGFIMGIVGCYEGYNSEGGTEGVGRSATNAVVVSSLLIILVDVLAVKLTVFFFDVS